MKMLCSLSLKLSFDKLLISISQTEDVSEWRWGENESIMFQGGGRGRHERIKVQLESEGNETSKGDTKGWFTPWCFWDDLTSICFIFLNFDNVCKISFSIPYILADIFVLFLISINRSAPRHLYKYSQVIVFSVERTTSTGRTLA